MNNPAAWITSTGLFSHLVIAGVAALLSNLLLWVLIPILRQRLLDQPNARSSHCVPTPRGGGVAFVLVGSVINACWGEGWAAWIPLMCLPLSLVGMLDDRYDLPAVLRYAAQVATAIGLVSVASLPLPIWSLPIVVIAVTAVINFFNFMDGLDGLVALSSLLLMATAGLWPLAGAILGFLLWNWNPAKVFMGDVGSTWLGAVFAGMVLQQKNPWDAICLLLVAAPLLGDAFTCVLRRLIAGQPIFQAHRLHLFQRLQRAGWSHAKVASIYALATGLLAVARQWQGLAAELSVLAVTLIIAFRWEWTEAVPFHQSQGNE